MEDLSIVGLFALATFMATLLHGSLSFGMAIMFLFVYQTGSVFIVQTGHYDIKYALFMQTFALFIINPYILCSVGLKRNFQMELVIPFIPMQLIGTPIGQYLAKYTSVSIMKLVIGCFIILFISVRQLFHHFTPPSKSQSEKITGKEEEAGKVDLEIGLEIQNAKEVAMIERESWTLKKVCILMTGFMTGFLEGLIEVQGRSFLIVFFLVFDYPREEIRANGALISFIQSCIRFIMYAITSPPPESVPYETWFSKEDLSIFLAVALTGIIATQIGLAVGQYINKGVHQLALVSLLFLNGISLITTGVIDYQTTQLKQ